jgi:hypothetical protein
MMIVERGVLYHVDFDPDTNTPFHNAARSDAQGLDKVGPRGGELEGI